MWQTIKHRAGAEAMQRESIQLRGDNTAADTDLLLFKHFLKAVCGNDQRPMKSLKNSLIRIDKNDLILPSQK
jgi:hypothetical protein